MDFFRNWRPAGGWLVYLALLGAVSMILVSGLVLLVSYRDSPPAQVVQTPTPQVAISHPAASHSATRHVASPHISAVLAAGGVYPLTPGMLAWPSPALMCGLAT